MNASTSCIREDTTEARDTQTLFASPFAANNPLTPAASVNLSYESNAAPAVVIGVVLQHER